MEVPDHGFEQVQKPFIAPIALERTSGVPQHGAPSGRRPGEVGQSAGTMHDRRPHDPALLAIGSQHRGADPRGHLPGRDDCEGPPNAQAAQRNDPRAGRRGRPCGDRTIFAQRSVLRSRRQGASGDDGRRLGAGRAHARGAEPIRALHQSVQEGHSRDAGGRIRHRAARTPRRRHHEPSLAEDQG